MQFKVIARGLPFSPYKIRPLVDVVRGKKVDYAIGWLTTYQMKRSVPVLKMIKSAVANAEYLKGISSRDLIIKEIKVDEGKISRYYKPGSMGRALVQRKRFCHMSVVLEHIMATKEV